MNSNLDSWLKKVQSARKRADVLSIVDEFRCLEWTDEERAQMGRAYVRVLSELTPDRDATPAAATDKPDADGPVWYEKH